MFLLFCKKRTGHLPIHSFAIRSVCVTQAPKLHYNLVYLEMHSLYKRDNRDLKAETSEVADRVKH